MRRQFAVFGIVTLAALGLSACGLTPRASAEDDTVLTERITSVRLDSGAGGLRLRGKTEATKVSLHRSVRYQDKQPGATHHVANGVLTLGGCGQSCSVDYTIDLPAGIPVSGETSDGSISLSGVGDVKVSTSNGTIDLDGVTGVVDVETSNGGIKGRGLKGDHIRALSSNGAIELSPATPQDITAETSNGRITVTVPPGKYQVSAETSLGGKDISVPNDPAGHRLDLTTDNGSITVKPA
jgi:Putative adhesin